MSSCLLLAAVATEAQDFRIEFGPQAGPLAKSGKFAEAEAALTAAGNPDPLAIAWLRLRQGKTEDAVALLENTLPPDGDERIAGQQRIAAFVGEVSAEEAARLTRRYLEAADGSALPAVALLKLQLASSQLDMRKPNEAEALVSQVIESGYSGPLLADVLFKLSTHLYENDRPDDALRHLKLLTDASPESKLKPQIDFQRAAVLIDTGQPLDALRILDDLETRHPDYAKAHRGMMLLVRANASYELGDMDDAAKAYRDIAEGATVDPQRRAIADIAKARLDEISLVSGAKRHDVRAADAEAPSLTSRSAAGRWSTWAVIGVNAALVATFCAIVLWRRLPWSRTMKMCRHVRAAVRPSPLSWPAPVACGIRLEAKVALAAAILAAAAAAGCGGDLSQSQAVAEPTEAAPAPAERSYDLGVVTESVSHPCLLGGERRKRVASVGTSCGCTTPDLEESDMLDFSKPFQVFINMSGKKPGKGSQLITIGFDDGTVENARLKYDYQPPPFADPKQIIFRPEEGERVITATYLGEPEVRVEEVRFPGGAARVVSSEPTQGGRIIKISVLPDRSNLRTSTEGTIDIVTSSEHRPRLSVPFLVLMN
ncbi:MAG: tetratricopeptide repeat protein [Planctomycetaceae bacterium]|nr:tetratricopeptide repeat protein [Planctomycetaceae bacterium]